MSRTLFGFGYGSAVILALTVSTTARSQSSAQTPAANAPSNAVTVEGCLLREVDVPGRQPLEGDRARVKGDGEYILTNTKMIKGSAPSTSTADAPKRDDTPTGTSGASGPSLLYKVEDIEQDQLEQHKGRRVQVDGVFAHLDRANNRPSSATDLVEIRGTAIRSVPGECPAK